MTDQEVIACKKEWDEALRNDATSRSAKMNNCQNKWFTDLLGHALQNKNLPRGVEDAETAPTMESDAKLYCVGVEETSNVEWLKFVPSVKDTEKEKALHEVWRYAFKRGWLIGVRRMIEMIEAEESQGDYGIPDDQP